RRRSRSAASPPSGAVYLRLHRRRYRAAGPPPARLAISAEAGHARGPGARGTAGVGGAGPQSPLDTYRYLNRYLIEARYSAGSPTLRATARAYPRTIHPRHLDPLRLNPPGVIGP